MSHVVITGAESMLGQYLARVFGYDQVTLLTRRDLDITNSDQVAKKIAALQPAILINCAAYNNVDQAETQDQDLANKINGAAVGYLADSAAQCGATFVTFSSEYVFDGTNRKGYAEDDVVNPVNVYGLSKALGESLVPITYNLKPITSHWYIIRTSRLFGKKGPGASSKQSFPDKLIELARGGKTEFDLVTDEISNPTYAGDLAESVKVLLQSHVPSGIYHRTNEDACSWFEFGSEVFRLKGISVKLNAVPGSKFPRPARRPEWGVLRTTKLPSMRSWQEALKDYVNFQFSNSNFPQ